MVVTAALKEEAVTKRSTHVHYSKAKIEVKQSAQQQFYA